MHVPDVEHEKRYFATRLSHDPRRERVWKYLTSYLAKFIPPEATVLELGAGYCYFINAVPAARRVAVDLAHDIRRWAGPGVEAHQQDALAYVESVPPASVDFAFASNFLEHLEWPVLDRLADALLVALRPGAAFGLIQPNFRLAPGRYFDDYTHRTVFTDTSLVDWLMSRGFEVVEVVPRFLPLTVKSRFGALSFLIPIYLRLPWHPFAGQMFVLARRPVDFSAQRPDAAKGMARDR